MMDDEQLKLLNKNELREILKAYRYLLLACRVTEEGIAEAEEVGKRISRLGGW